MQRENELASGPDTVENRCFTSPFDGKEGIHGKASVTLEYPEDLSDHQVTQVEAYAALYALGGYTYNNVVQEASDEQCNSANEGEDNTDNNQKVRKALGKSITRQMRKR